MGGENHSHAIKSNIADRCNELLTKTALDFIYYYANLCLFAVPVFILHLFFSNHFFVENDIKQALIPSLIGSAVFLMASHIRHQHRNNQPATWWLYFFVYANPLSFFLISLNNMLYPGVHDYGGILYSIDANILIFQIFCLPMLQSLRLVLQGGLLFALALALLLQLETSLLGEHVSYTTHVYSLWACWVFLAIALSALFTIFMRKLVIKSAETAVLEEKTRQSLQNLMQEHHDAHSVLSSAQLNLDLLRKQFKPDNLAPLQEDLSVLKSVVKSIKQQSLEEISVTQIQAISHFFNVLKKSALDTAKTHPDIKVSFKLPNGQRSVAFFDGEAGLKRVLINLINNSAEGNGDQRATQIYISAQIAESEVEITLADNGPGYPDGTTDNNCSTKPGGTGSGLSIVQRLVELSGGEINFFNDTNGACTRIVLPTPKATT